MKCSVKLASALLALLFVNVRPSHSQATPEAKSEPSKADALPSVDEIAAKCAKGSGGKEAWAKISTLVMTGTMEIPAAGLTGKVEITAKAPNKALRVVSIADGQFVQKQAFDGRVGWKSDPQTGLKKLEGPELEGARMEAIFDTEIRLKEIYPDMKVTGRTKVGDRDAYTVLAHEPGGKAVTFYFDAETGLRIAEDSENPDESGKTVKSTVFFEDYRAVGGIQAPYRIRVTSPAVNLVIQIQEVNLNVPVNDSVFAMPAANPPAGGSTRNENKAETDPAAFDPGTFSQDLYVNHFLGIRYEAPTGWTPHGEETKKELMAAGKSLLDSPGRKAITDRAEERTHQLLTLFQYPLGTPGVENPLIQIMAEDVRFAPGIRSGKEYLLNVAVVMKRMKSQPKVDEEPKEVTYGGRTMHRMDVVTQIPTKTLYQSMIAVVLKGYAVSFAFTSNSAEGRDNLVKTLETLRFEDTSEAPKPR